jgi:hypothetical protein
MLIKRNNIMTNLELFNSKITIQAAKAATLSLKGGYITTFTPKGEDVTPTAEAITLAISLGYLSRNPQPGYLVVDDSTKGTTQEWSRKVGEWDTGMGGRTVHWMRAHTSGTLPMSGFWKPEES